MELFYILDDVTCTTEMNTLIKIVKWVLSLLQWLIPVALIIFGTIDMLKAVSDSSGKDDAQKKARKTFINRLIYALVAFLIPFFIKLAFGVIGDFVDDDKDTDITKVRNGNFFECWDYKGVTVDTPTDADDDEYNCHYTDEEGNTYDYHKSNKAECMNLCGINETCVFDS